MPKLFFTIFLFFITFNFFSQEVIEYVGFIKLNDSTMISYKLNFIEENGIISGFSITDLSGEHETKSMISGIYDENKGTMKFQEYDILYTKSPVTQNDFCFINFEGKLKKISDKHKMEGNFKGLFKDGQKCIDGNISMLNINRIMKRAEKMDKKISRSKLIDDETKNTISFVKTLDTLNNGVLIKNENLNIFSKSQNVKLVYFDGGKIDGDIISISVNDKFIVENYMLTAEKKELLIPINNLITSIKIYAINEGSSPPNTMNVEFTDFKNQIGTYTNLKKGEHTEITVNKVE